MPLVSCVIVALVIVVGCSPDPVPTYDRMRVQLIREMFDAVAKQNHDLAIRKLERLAPLLPDEALIQYLQRVEADNVLLQKCDVLVQNGAYQAAVEHIRRTIKEEGETPRLVRARDQLAGVTQILLYLKSQPFDTAASAVAAVGKLPPPEVFPGNEDTYIQWLKLQTAKVAELVQREKARLIDELIDEIDIALACDHGGWPVAIAQLGALAPENPDYLALARLDSPQLTLAAAADTSDGRVREMLLNHLFSHGDSEVRDKISILVQGRPAASFSGTQLLADVDLMKQQYLAGLIKIRLLMAELPGYRVHYAVDVNMVVDLGEDGSAGAPSVPSVLKFLDRLIHDR